MSKIKGYVNPRYLDQKWFRNFSVSRDKKTVKDIPVIVEFDHDSYESYRCDITSPTYFELEQTINQLTKERDEIKAQLREANELLIAYNKMVKDEFLKPKGFTGRTDIDDHLEKYEVSNE